MYAWKRLRKGPPPKRYLLGDHRSPRADVRLGSRHPDRDRLSVHSVLSWAAMAEDSLRLVRRYFTLGGVVDLSDLRHMHDRLATKAEKIITRTFCVTGLIYGFHVEIGAADAVTAWEA